jgi:hypothetical protein
MERSGAGAAGLRAYYVAVGSADAKLVSETFHQAILYLSCLRNRTAVQSNAVTRVTARMLMPCCNSSVFCFRKQLLHSLHPAMFQDSSSEMLLHALAPHVRRTHLWSCWKL